LGDDIEGSHLDCGRKAPLEIELHVDRYRGPLGEAVDGGVESPVGKDGGVEASSKLAQLLECCRELSAGAVEDLDCALPGGCAPALREAEGERERDQALLRPVVQIPLEPAPLRVSGFHDPAA